MPPQFRMANPYDSGGRGPCTARDHARHEKNMESDWGGRTGLYKHAAQDALHHKTRQRKDNLEPKHVGTCFSRSSDRLAALRLDIPPHSRLIVRDSNVDEKCSQYVGSEIDKMSYMCIGNCLQFQGLFNEMDPTGNHCLAWATTNFWGNHATNYPTASEGSPEAATLRQRHAKTTSRKLKSV